MKGRRSLIRCLWAVAAVIALAGISLGNRSIALADEGIKSRAVPLQVPLEELTGKVYVLPDGSISVGMPQLKQEQSSLDINSNHAGAAVKVCFEVVPARLVVVDESGAIKAVYSNTGSRACDFYALSVKDEGGVEGQLTPDIIRQYNCLLSTINWSRCGKVYSTE